MGLEPGEDAERDGHEDEEWDENDVGQLHPRSDFVPAENGSLVSDRLMAVEIDQVARTRRLQMSPNAFS